MKRRLLASVTAAAILFGACNPALALFGVGDIVFDPASYGELVQEAKNGLEDLKWMADIYGDAEKSLQQLVHFYNLFAHVTDATQLAQVLNREFVQSPMLTEALQLEQAFTGRGLHTSLAAKINAIASRLRYYKPSNNDFSGFHLNHRADATAGQLASAEDAMTGETARIAGLNQLMNGINSPDTKRVQDIGARASIEGALATAAGNRLMAAKLMQDAQRDTAQQQQEQAFRFSTDTMFQQADAAANAAKGGAVNLITR